jgi:hypothetical protein
MKRIIALAVLSLASAPLHARDVTVYLDHTESMGINQSGEYGLYCVYNYGSNQYRVFLEHASYCPFSIELNVGF